MDQPPLTKQRSYDDEDSAPPQRPPYKEDDIPNQRPPYIDEENAPNEREPIVETVQRNEKPQDVEGSLPDSDTRRSPPRSISPEDRAPYEERTSTKAPLTDEDDSRSSKRDNPL